MGLDIGVKRIGVALSDETGILAQSREVIFRKNETHVFARIKELAEEFGVKEIVVGLPINMNGTFGEKAREAKEFSEKLKKETSLSVKLWDERLSTKEAEDILVKASFTRRKRKKVIDKLAAQIILQGYLDKKLNIKYQKSK